MLKKGFNIFVSKTFLLEIERNIDSHLDSSFVGVWSMFEEEEEWWEEEEGEEEEEEWWEEEEEEEWEEEEW